MNDPKIITLKSAFYSDCMLVTVYGAAEDFADFPIFFYLTWLDGVPREIRRKTFEAWNKNFVTMMNPYRSKHNPLLYFLKKKKHIST